MDRSRRGRLKGRGEWLEAVGQPWQRLLHGVLAVKVYGKKTARGVGWAGREKWPREVLFVF